MPYDTMVVVTETVNATVVVSLTIVNGYGDGLEQVTAVENVTVPAPSSASLDEWADEHLFPLTGTGRHGGESWYAVTVTSSSDAQLTGHVFTFGV